MSIDSVKHVQTLTTVLSNILAEPLGLAYPPLMIAAAKGMQAVILNAWPRVSVHRGEVLRGLTFAWLRCCEEGGKEGVEDVEKEVKEAAEMLEALQGMDESLKEAWEGEKRELVGADGRLAGLLCEG
jgi:hypothetical protein